MADVKPYLRVDACRVPCTLCIAELFRHGRVFGAAEPPGIFIRRGIAAVVRDTMQPKGEKGVLVRG